MLKIKMMNKENNIIAITFNALELLHAGHVGMLAEEKKYCNYLIVGLHTNPTIDRSEKTDQHR